MKRSKGMDEIKSGRNLNHQKSPTYTNTRTHQSNLETKLEFNRIVELFPAGQVVDTDSIQIHDRELEVINKAGEKVFDDVSEKHKVR